jgi:chromate transporter
MTHESAEEQPVSFREALRFWFKLGWISFGGPAGQIAIMHRELVERRRWISEERFLHALNFCMLLPGPEAQQLATYIGWLKHRALGGVAAGVLFVLPGFVIITVISILYISFSSLTALQGVLFGLKAAVLAVVLEAVVRIARRALTRRLHWFIAAAAFVAIYAFGVSFPVIVAAAALMGFVERRMAPSLRLTLSPTKSGAPTNDFGSDVTQSVRRGPGPLRVLAVCLTLWFAPLLLLYAALGPDHVLTLEGLFFSKMAVVTFGGAYAALAYVAQETVQRYHWLSADDMMQGLALAETTPGPLILVLTFVGFVAAFRDAAPFDPLSAGLLGAALTTWVTFVPCFLWILLGAPHLERLRSNPALSAALASVTAAIVGVILNLAIWFGLHALFTDVRTFDGFGLQAPIPVISSIDVRAAVIAAAAMIALLRFKTPMVPTLAAAAAAGFVLRGLE